VIDEPVRGSLPDPSFGSLPGIDRARAWLRGVAPRGPLHHLTGVRLTQVGSGTAVLAMPATPWLQTFDGFVDSRILVETGLAFAVLTGAPAGTDVRPMAITVNNLRQGILEGETLVARARTVNSGVRGVEGRHRRDRRAHRSRVQALAEPGDILLSGTVHDVVTGSGLPFTDRGRHGLKGVQGEWQIYALADSSHS
jgi:hypothetical protein